MKVEDLFNPTTSTQHPGWVPRLVLRIGSAGTVVGVWVDPCVDGPWARVFIPLTSPWDWVEKIVKTFQWGAAGRDEVRVPLKTSAMSFACADCEMKAGLAPPGISREFECWYTDPILDIGNPGGAEGFYYYCSSCARARVHRVESKTAQEA